MAERILDKTPPSRWAFFLFKKISVIGLFFFLSAAAIADDNAPVVSLAAKPARCIALHEGQVCYQTVRFEWRTSVAEAYCLYEEGAGNPLQCWESGLQGAARYEFESKLSKKFVLLRKRDSKVMTQFVLEVAWVYDASSHRESHWRIF